MFRSPKKASKGAAEKAGASSGEMGVVRTKYQGALKEIGELREQFRKFQTRIETLDKESRTQIAILKNQTKRRMPELANTETQLTASSKAYVRHLAQLDDAAARLEGRAQNCIQKMQAGEQRVFANCNKAIEPTAKQLQDLFKHFKDAQAKVENSYGATKQKLVALSRNIESRGW
jgi:chromosome segregation ATPase